MPENQPTPPKYHRIKVPKTIDAAFHRLHWDLNYVNRYTMIGT